MYVLRTGIIRWNNKRILLRVLIVCAGERMKKYLFVIGGTQNWMSKHSRTNDYNHKSEVQIKSNTGYEKKYFV